MFPLRDVNPTASRPVATAILVGLNLATWFFVQGMGTSPAFLDSICRLGLIPAELLGHLPAGSSVPLGDAYTCVLDGAGSWNSLSSMFMHGGWGHLVGNMWFLWVFGDNVEDVMGRFRFVVFYLLCGFAADIAQMAANPVSAVPMIGASGAIGGVMGAYAVQFPRARVHAAVFIGIFFKTFDVPARAMLVLWFVMQLILGLPTIDAGGGGVAFWAHVGGFLAGVLLLLPFRHPARAAAHQEAIYGRRAKTHFPPD